MNVASFMFLAKVMLTYLPCARARKLWFDHPCHVSSCRRISSRLRPASPCLIAYALAGLNLAGKCQSENLLCRKSSSCLLGFLGGVLGACQPPWPDRYGPQLGQLD